MHFPHSFHTDLYVRFIGHSDWHSPLCVSFSLLANRAIGVGAVQANMAVFGAEQVREQKATTQYFDKYYAVVNTGGLIAFAFIAYAQQNDSYFLGYIVPAALLVVAFILFLIGYQFYTHVQPQDSVISHILPVFINAFQTWRKSRSTARRSVTSPRSSNLFGNQIDPSDQLSLTTSGQSWSFLDYAKLSNQGRFIDRIVDDIKSLRRIIVVFLLLTPYWLLYFQVSIVIGSHLVIWCSFFVDLDRNNVSRARSAYEGDEILSHSWWCPLHACDLAFSWWSSDNYW